MLLPKFSIRLILLLTAAAAVFFLVVRFAIGGKLSAVGFVAAAVFVLCAFMIYGLGFGIAFLLTRITKFAVPPTPPASPFVGEALPPQVIPPSTQLTE